VGEHIDIKTILTIIHLFGVAIGAGGAYATDVMFFKSVRDERISKTEMGFLTLGSSMTIIGLILLIVSGVGLFSLNTALYLTSSKFLAKMTIVCILIINGIIFHKSHMPRLLRHLGHHLPSSDEFIRRRTFFLTSGVISVASWSFALVLGALRSVPYSYTTIMLTYLFIVFIGVLFVFLIKNHILPHHKQ
jgi:hypothetical protein